MKLDAKSPSEKAELWRCYGTVDEALVAQFHRKFNRAIGGFPGENFADRDQRRLRAALILEEAIEFVVACGFDPIELIDSVPSVLAAQRAGHHGDYLTIAPEPDFPAAIDALGDLKYVTAGANITFGVPCLRPFMAIHDANMQKENGGENAMGKILKPEGWRPPDIAAELRGMGWAP